MNDQIERSKTLTNDDFNDPAWNADFHLKGDSINSRYPQSSPEALYIAFAGSLDSGCTVYIEELPKNRVRRISNFYELLPLLDQYKKVLIYTKEFTKTTSLKMRFMEYMIAFVIDIDGIRSYNINVALDKIEQSPVKPNFIVNSGNGLHLYYIFKEKFDFMNYTCGMAFLRKVKRIKVYGNKKKREIITTADKVKDVYASMLEWVDDPSYKTDKLHLAHGIRMFGGKTKNPEIMSTVYKCSNGQYDLWDLAEIVGVKLTTQAELNRCPHKLLSDAYTTLFVNYKDEVEISTDDDDSIDYEIISNDYDQEEETALSTSESPSDTNAPIDIKAILVKMYKSLEDRKSDLEPKRLIPKWNAYEYLVSAIKEYNYVSIRNRCLFIMCCRGKFFQIPVQRVRKDLEEMAAHMNKVTPDDPITQENIEKAFDGYFNPYWFSNDKITEKTGIPFPKKQKELREESALMKEEEKALMLEIIDEVYANNPKTSFRDMSDILSLRGIKRGKSFLATDPDVIAIRNKYRGNHH